MRLRMQNKGPDVEYLGEEDGEEEGRDEGEEGVSGDPKVDISNCRPSNVLSPQPH